MVALTQNGGSCVSITFLAELHLRTSGLAKKKLEQMHLFHLFLAYWSQFGKSFIISHHIVAVFHQCVCSFFREIKHLHLQFVIMSDALPMFW